MTQTQWTPWGQQPLNPVHLNLPRPPSVNSAYANGGNKRGRHKTAVYRSWEQEAGICIKDSHRAGFKSYSLHIAMERFNARADLANYEKCLSDFLVAHGVVQDDSGLERLTMEWGVNLPAPCVVLIQEAA